MRVKIDSRVTIIYSRMHRASLSAGRDRSDIFCSAGFEKMCEAANLKVETVRLLTLEMIANRVASSPETEKELCLLPFDAFGDVLAEAISERGPARDLIYYSRGFEVLCRASGVCLKTLRLVTQKLVADREKSEPKKIAA